MKTLIDHKAFGKLLRIDGWYYSGWIHNGVHFIDTINYLLNDNLDNFEILRINDSPYENDYNIDLRLNSTESSIPIFINCYNEKYYQLFEFDFKFSKARIRIEDFGSRVIVEEAVVNYMDENVLRLIDSEKIFGINEVQSPIYNAISRLHNHLIGKDELSGIELNDIFYTMNIIWKIQKLAEHEFK